MERDEAKIFLSSEVNLAPCHKRTCHGFGHRSIFTTALIGSENSDKSLTVVFRLIRRIYQTRRHSSFARLSLCDGA